VATVSDEVIEGVVRPGPPPADAVRPEVVIRAEDGDIVQAVVRLDDGTVVEVTAPDPSTFAAEPLPDFTAERRMFEARVRLSAPCLNPRDMVRITGT
jgi:hypothetical protein